MAGLAAGAFALTGAAGFAQADTPPSSSLSGTVVVTSTLSIQPSTGGLTPNPLDAAPGVPTAFDAFNFQIASSDGSGYTLTSYISSPFAGIPNSAFSTDEWTDPGGVFGQPQTYTLSDPAFGATGPASAVQLFTTPWTSGNTGDAHSQPGTPNGGGSPISLASPAGDDQYTSVIHLTVPANTPGSPALGVSGTFQYLLTGN